MGTFGERLRREREKRGIGLDEIATATKISARNLRALEDEKFNQLPGGIFNRGFVRAYAKYLGIDEEAIVAEYVQASQDTEEAREEKLKAELGKHEIRKDTDSEEREINLEPKSQWTTIAIIVLLAVVAYGGYSIYQKKKAEHAQPAPVVPAASTVEPQSVPASTPNVDKATNPTAADVATASSPPPQPSATTTAAPKTEPPSPAASTPPPVPAVSSPASTTATTISEPTPINLTMKVKEETWVEVKADGKTLVSGTLSPGTERSFKGKDKVEVKLGKAAGVEMSYNGKPVATPANIQDVRKLTFTPTGYE